MIDKRRVENEIKIQNLAQFINEKLFNGRICFTIDYPSHTRKRNRNDPTVGEVDGRINRCIVPINYNDAVVDKQYLATTIITQFILNECDNRGLIPDSLSYYKGKKSFGAVAKEVGCQISYSYPYGCEIISFPDCIVEYLDSLELDRYKYYKRINIKTYGGDHSIRYTCPTCDAIARTTKPTDLICGKCGKPMTTEN